MSIPRDRFSRIIRSGRILGPNHACENHPCHFDEQDCTWCFCPFYPCEDDSTGGKLTETKQGKIVWGCADCDWIHKPEVAQRVLDEFLKTRAPHKISREKLLQIRSKILREVSPRS